MSLSEEKHAELCYTECLFLDALLTFIQVLFLSNFLIKLINNSTSLNKWNINPDGVWISDLN